MAIFNRRQRENPAPAPAASPSTVVGLLAWAISDWGRTFRFITVLVFFVIGITVTVDVVMIAAEGIHVIKPRYLLPTGVFGGSYLVISLTSASLTVLLRKKKQRRASEKTPPATR